MSKGNPLIGLRIPAELIAEINTVLASRKKNRRGVNTLNVYIREAIRSKLIAESSEPIGIGEWSSQWIRWHERNKT
jgi:hypothetical protein